jgi:hypothetical protein
METSTASTDTATTTDKLRIPLSASGFGSGLHVIWRSGYMFVSKGDERISSEYEAPEKEFRQMAHMIEHFVQRAYERGKDDQATEIRRILNIKEEEDGESQ